MRRESFLVGAHGVRPAGPPDRCFYCDVPVGEEHADGCTIRHRTVVLRLTTEYVVGVPEDWDDEMVAFYYNDGTWCTDNAVDDIRNHVGEAGCICSISKVDLVREATEDDEATSEVRVERIAS